MRESCCFNSDQCCCCTSEQCQYVTTKFVKYMLIAFAIYCATNSIIKKPTELPDWVYWLNLGFQIAAFLGNLYSDCTKNKSRKDEGLIFTIFMFNTACSVLYGYQTVVTESDQPVFKLTFQILLIIFNLGKLLAMYKRIADTDKLEIEYILTKYPLIIIAFMTSLLSFLSCQDKTLIQIWDSYVQQNSTTCQYSVLYIVNISLWSLASTFLLILDILNVCNILENAKFYALLDLACLTFSVYSLFIFILEYFGLISNNQLEPVQLLKIIVMAFTAACYAIRVCEGYACKRTKANYRLLK